MKRKFALTNFKLFSNTSESQDAAILVDKGMIVKLVSNAAIPADYEIDDLQGHTLTPGFLDIQVNGGGDTLFNDNPSVENIKSIASAHRKYGTTQCLPTLISDDIDKVKAAIEAVDQAIADNVAGVIGIHLEGPFLNKHKKGIHDASKFIDLTEALIPTISSLKRGKTLVTLAPDSVDSHIIEMLVESGSIVFAGHTNATYEQCVEAEKSGLSGYTHLYNAMSALESRAPGAVGAALSSDSAYFGVIADGHHVHPAALNVAVKAKPHHTILVTDAMPSVGGTKPYFELGKEKISVSGGRCLSDSGTLAGSHLSMQDAVINIQQFCNVSLPEAITMASLNPAKMLGLDKIYGKIEPGYSASFTVLSELGKVTSTYINGEKEIY
ncbi:N-acetylglucosamine-6-phosphate deacetylase [Alteromonas sp. 5E99-2]|uniref:N-acetylglucosamine-6-phosphate deacetylase n=1 Tax=Alteromonas sp. 5E99-2 TaxID=2817683 RepID=UPI001A9922F9|nr:N-acetylglucosamine-6-phosphate deacetylase [Alteromonas sp. 5E99-2]MBO1256720.1 N-acetylglucosamine-6-phosphate deacetylase [Alteromonas sp. 5E99-2]